MIKYRYQNRAFKTSLDNARRYKRQRKKIPQTSREIFFARLGIGSWPAKTAVVLALAALVYLTYAPNFFFVKNIDVQGLKIAERQEILSKVKDFLSAKSFFPKKNLLFTNTSALANFLQKDSLYVAKVDKITKTFPNSLTIAVAPRYPKYFVENQGKIFALSADGLVMGISATSSELSLNLTKLAFESAGNWAVGQKVLSDDVSALIQKAVRDLPDKAGLPFKDIRVLSDQSQDLEVDTQSGFLLKLDVKTSWDESLSNLSALLGQMSAGELQNLAYIDLRVPQKAYVCDKTAPCANMAALVAGEATTTQSNIPPVQN